MFVCAMMQVFVFLIEKNPTAIKLLTWFDFELVIFFNKNFFHCGLCAFSLNKGPLERLYLVKGITLEISQDTPGPDSLMFIKCGSLYQTQLILR